MSNYQQNELFPEISILICTYNRSALLKKALMSFFDVKGASIAEIIVIDNNSTDDTKEVVRKCKEELEDVIKIDYILEKRQGLSYARNTGINHSKGEFIAFLDDDAVPCSDWLIALREGLRSSPQVSLVGGPIEPVFEVKRPEWLSKHLEPLYTILDLGDTVKLFPKKNIPMGANMAFKASFLCKYKFPEHLGRKGNSLISGEENWVINKLLGEGLEILYLPNMRIKHFVAKERLSVEWLLNRYYYEGKSRAYSSDSFLQIMQLFIITILKLCYLILSYQFVTTNSSKLLISCRINIQLGVLTGFNDRKFMISKSG